MFLFQIIQPSFQSLRVAFAHDADLDGLGLGRAECCGGRTGPAGRWAHMMSS